MQTRGALRHALLASVMRGRMVLALMTTLSVAVCETAVGDDEFQVNSSATSAAAPEIASAPDGSFVITWISTPDAPASFAQIAAKRFTSAGVPLADEFRVDSTGGTLPTLAINASGAFTIAWWSDELEIHGRRRAASGATVGNEFIATNPPFAGLTPTGNSGVAAIFLDQFVVIWEGTSDFLRQDIYARRIDSAGVPIGNGFQVNASFVGDHSFPAVTADSVGNYVVAWHVGATIQARKFTSAGAFGPPFDIAAVANLGVAIAADAAGRFIAVWTLGGTVMGRRFGTDTLPIGPAFRVDESAAASLPDVAAYPDGRFVVAWQKSINGFEDVDVRARRFDALGQPASAEIDVNVTTAGVQSVPSIAVGANEDAVVVWTSQAPLVNESDVVARRLGVNVTDAIFADGFDAVTPAPQRLH